MKLRTPVWVVGGASVLVFIGSLLPWITAQVSFISVSENGTSGDGKITLIFSLITIGALLAEAKLEHIAWRFVAALSILVMFGVSLYDTIHIGSKSYSSGSIHVSAGVGSGLYICLIASIVAAVAWVVDFRSRDSDVTKVSQVSDPADQLA